MNIHLNVDNFDEVLHGNIASRYFEEDRAGSGYGASEPELLRVDAERIRRQMQEVAVENRCWMKIGDNGDFFLATNTGRVRGDLRPKMGGNELEQWAVLGKIMGCILFWH
ncbi:hypothetical protein Fot_22502 [Forsythia ovata]|uniref:Uncharacterized protein n=1 Tax=Forsythia ovata TaxID=205694 RepID=A0ABD1UXX4_9LAMI